MDYKTCSKCENNFPFTDEYFYTHQQTNSCKACLREYGRKHYQKNKEKRKEQARRYYEENKDYVSEYQESYYKNNKEIVKQKSKEYYYKNREEVLKRVKRYKKENPDKIKEWRIKNKKHIKNYNKKYNRENADKIKITSRLWQINNPEKVVAIAQRRESRKRKLPATLTVEQWEQIKIAFDNSCAYCGEILPLEQEHFIPLSKGGEYTHNNIIPSCKSCNCSKKDNDFFVWYPQQNSYSKQREKRILEYLNYQDEGIQQLALDVI